MDEDAPRRRETITTAAAAQIVGRSQETVRRWFDRHEAAGTPVGERERGPGGEARGQTWRRPYLDCVQEWRRQIEGVVSAEAGSAPAGELRSAPVPADPPRGSGGPP